MGASFSKEAPGVAPGAESCDSGLGRSNGEEVAGLLCLAGLHATLDPVCMVESPPSYPGHREKAALSQTLCAFPRGHCSWLPGNQGLQVSPWRQGPGYLGLGQAQ